MKTTTIFLILLLLYSCRESSHNKKYILYPDSTNFEYKLVKPDLLKVIRFFPGTKDTSQIFFHNINSRHKDSVEYYYDRNGNIKLTTEFQDSLMNKYIIKKYRKDGTPKLSVQFENNEPKIKHYYYPSGKLKILRNFIKVDNRISINGEIHYFENGDINIDSTLYADLKCNKDTVSIGDSIVCKFDVLMPAEMKYKIITGKLDENFNPIGNPKKLTKIKYDKFILKPNKTGKNTYRFIVIYSPEDEKIKKTGYFLLKKEILVTK
ncbi:MAG: hypothetical protein GXO80_03055 [Chlorobi bacterium]|nr:hypothetical protein [Chlorobiota bacterium]